MTPQEIKNLRKTLGLTQTEFAAKVGVRFPTVSRWECGKNAPTGSAMVHLEAMAAAIEKKSKSSRGREK